MGIKERQERDREAKSSAILDAARPLRQRKCGTSPCAVAGASNTARRDLQLLSVEGRDFHALAEEGIRLFADCDARSLDGLPAIERLRRIVLRTRPIQHQTPAVSFALMFVDRTVPRICREYEQFAFAREMRQELAAGWNARPKKACSREPFRRPRLFGF